MFTIAGSVAFPKKAADLHKRTCFILQSVSFSRKTADLHKRTCSLLQKLYLFLGKPLIYIKSMFTIAESVSFPRR